jgi:hypothetical protein
MNPETGAVVATTRVYTDLTDLEPAPTPSFDGAGRGKSSAPSRAHAKAPASPSPSAASMSYDALADALNEQYSTSLPASDFDDFNGSFSSSFEDISTEWMKVRTKLPQNDPRQL